MLAIKGDLSGWWSRRITAEHRFVYRVSGKGNDRAWRSPSCDITTVRSGSSRQCSQSRKPAPRLVPQLFVWLQPRVCGNSPGFSTMRMFQSILGRQPDPGTL
ncbi:MULTISPECIES: type II toxin-antitoxin system YoeB family toxin [unclassified Phaeobacter]|uniref:type II toxin-antitoxin system YoeB family toxin n=1 Tax=unclassified Phaeobacter TaxID=2621772 RepID=UPI003A876BA4